MSQHDMNIINASFPAVRADLNLALVALAENSRGATEPATMFANQPWADTTSGIFKIRNDANTAWISVFYLATGKAVSNPNTTDASGGVAGLTLFKINFKNALNTFTSFFTNANTAARTYTFQDKTGTIADTADVSAAQAAILALGWQGSSFATYTTTGSLTTDDLGRPFFWNTASSGTLTLPASAGVTVGQIISCYVNSSAAGILTIARDGTDVIFSELAGSSTSIALIGGDFLTLVYGGGGGWIVLAKSNGGIGRNQTCQSVIGSRAINTNYTNTTGRPIQVNVSGTFINGATVKIVVDGISMHYAENNQSGVTLWWTVSAIVPPNSVFNLTSTGTAPTVSTWAELR